MPIYEYRCKACERTVELIQKFSDAPLTTCEHCGGALERLISAPGLHFKGTGWYVTDYARAGKQPSDGKQSSDGKPATDGKTETKSEKKSDKPAAPAAKSD